MVEKKRIKLADIAKSVGTSTGKEIILINGIDFARIDGRVFCSIKGKNCGANLCSDDCTCDEMPYDDCLREMSKLPRSERIGE